MGVGRAFALILVCCSVAAAGEVSTRAELDALLADGSYLEDFEGISVQGGTSITANSPLDSATQPTWHLLQGVKYTSSGGHLTLYSGSLNGNSSNILEAFAGDLRITFNQQQLGVGLDLVNGTGNVSFMQTVSFYHGANELGTLVFNIGPASSNFAGWQDSSVGITSIRILGNPVEEIDNVEWGVVVNTCAPPGDMNHDGFVRGDDVQLFINCVLSGGTSCACADMDGNSSLSITDVQLFVNALLAG